ncbi:MAG: alpha/beta hydrolase [Deltaproteobacteria bacterium]|nr:alpha/beta hydrolase [Deltaproteobacteria bacterium]
MGPANSEQTGTVQASDGIKLFFRNYPVENETARLVLVHGLGEHSGRYGHVISLLNNKGISVTTYDHRGHGKSEGKRGHVLRFDEYVADLSLIIDKAVDQMPGGMKILLLGHSMGGLIVLNYIEKFPDKISAVIASSPGLAPADKVPVVKGTLGKLMSSIWPSLTFDNELNPDDLSHDRQVVESYVSDPLVHRRISSRWFTEFLKAMDETVKSGANIKIPFLLQVAGSDHIVSPATSKNFFKTVGSTDKTLHFYDGLFHEIYNEKGDSRQRVLSDLESWIDDHV